MTEGTTEDDQFDLDALEDGGDAGSNKNFADLRKYARKMEREAKAANAKVEELSTFQASVLEERRTAALDTVFKEVGLSPKHAALFAKVNPDADITADAVKSFAAEYELATVTGDVVAAPETEASGLTPIIKGSDTGNSQGAGGKLPSAEWLKLQGTDLAKAQQMFKAGLVDFGDAIGHDRGYVDLESQA
jgi:hypothetical protein